MTSIYDEILSPVALPKMFRAIQHFDASHIEDVSSWIRNEVDSFPDISVVRGKRVAVGIGSRGISNLPLLAKTLIDSLKSQGAEVFIVPSMGSHGGAIAENQKTILHHLGISETSMGVPIIASMDTVKIGATVDDIPVHMDKNAASADYTVTLARIKPHCSFRGKYESGMVKMCVIGLGKQHGADYCHFQGMAHMGENLDKIGRVYVEKSNLLFSLGIIENAYDDICYAKVVAKQDIMEIEPGLQEYAKTLLPKIPFKNLDLLIIDEFGKNITGTGMDCNVIQRFTSEHMQASPITKRLVTLRLTKESDGNASGFGLADISTRKAYESMEMAKTYPNLLTSRTVIGGRIPLIMENDYDAIRAGIKTAPDVDYKHLRVVRIKNTLKLSELEISEALVEEAKNNAQVTVLSTTPCIWEFDENRNLKL
ncbi:MAG: DUF362 domain-containing protein [Sphaerochaeta sp.]|nr:lactate racemase domain-containing protein [Sphaerochaeta sp.]